MSSNIVGYQKLNLSADVYTLTGIQFVKVGGNVASLNDLFSGDIPFGTRIMVQGLDGYDSYKYLAEAYDEAADDFVAGWADGDEYLTSDPFVNGTGVWVIASDDTEGFTQSGQVSDAATITISAKADVYTLVCNPFPQGFNPNAVNWSAGLEFGTRIMVKGEDGYDSYKYLEEAYDEAADDFVEGWGDGDEYLVKDDIVPSGEGFWLVAPSDTDFIIENPTK